MTFDAREVSAYDGRPVELFEFAREYQYWRYTSADRVIETATAGTYQPRAISRSAIEVSAEKQRSNITVTGPRDLEVADLYRVTPPTITITLVVRQLHQGDNELATIWTGRILSVEFVGAGAQINCEPVATALRRVGLRRMYQRQCPHVLYGVGCGVNRTSFVVFGSVDSIVGNVANVPQAGNFPNAYFAGGYLEFEVALGIYERRFITDQTGGALTLATSPYGMKGGMAVRLYPGCDHQLTTCNSKFSNTANYGGFPFIPLKNPFGGDPIF